MVLLILILKKKNLMKFQIKYIAIEETLLINIISWGKNTGNIINNLIKCIHINSIIDVHSQKKSNEISNKIHCN